MSKYLGQHFLLNRKKIGKIVEALDLKSGDIIVEIGPGKGALTIPLAEQCQELDCKIIAIEKDEELAENLEIRIQNLGLENIEIIEGDALKEIKNQISTRQLADKITNQNSKIIENLKIIGNIPYYITGYLFRILGELENKPSLIALTIQKEVAQRICASPPHKKFGVGARPPKMNLLAASVQFWAEPKIIGYIPKKDFRPAPKVDSAIIIIKPLALCLRSQVKCYMRDVKNCAENYYRFIKILFKQPRKTIANNLFVVCRDAKNANARECREKIAEKLQKIGVEPNARPQDLSIEQIKELSKIIGNYQDLLKA